MAESYGTIKMHSTPQVSLLPSCDGHKTMPMDTGLTKEPHAKDLNLILAWFWTNSQQEMSQKSDERTLQLFGQGNLSIYFETAWTMSFNAKFEECQKNTDVDKRKMLDLLITQMSRQCRRLKIITWKEQYKIHHSACLRTIALISDSKMRIFEILLKLKFRVKDQAAYFSESRRY